MITQGRQYMYVNYVIRLRTFSAYYLSLSSEQCKTKINELKEQEGQADNILKDAMGLWSAHEVSCSNTGYMRSDDELVLICRNPSRPCLQFSLSSLRNCLQDALRRSTRQAKCVSFLECKLRVVSEIYLPPAVEMHPTAREASRRKLMKNAKKHMEAGIENQKVRSIRLVLLKKDIQMRSSLLRMPTHSSSTTKPCSCLEPRSERSRSSCSSCTLSYPLLSVCLSVCSGPIFYFRLRGYGIKVPENWQSPCRSTFSTLVPSN